MVTKDDVISLLLHGDNYAFITAWRGELDNDDNYARMGMLNGELLDIGSTVLLVAGVYEGQREWSYLAIGISADSAIKLGRKYQQDSVLLPDALVFCSNGASLPTIARVISAGQPQGDHSIVYVNGEQVNHVVHLADVTVAA